MAVAIGEQKRRREAMDQLVAEISKGEAENVASSIRAAIERGWFNSFNESLADAKKKKEAEIDRICSRHYSDFLTSVSEMLELRGAASHLKDLVTDVHKKFNTTGGDLVSILSELNVIQTERENTRELLELTLQGKDIAVLLVRTREQIEADDHYNAMRTIETIQKELKSIEGHPLSGFLEKWLPIAINKLLYSVRSEVDMFLSDRRSQVRLIGNTILIKQTQISVHDSSHIDAVNLSLQCRTSNVAELEKRKSVRTRRSSISLSHLSNLDQNFDFEQLVEPSEFDELIAPHFSMVLDSEGVQYIENDLCDIAPLHKTLHLYAILGDLNAYHDYYRSQRLNYLNSILRTFDRTVNQVGLFIALPSFFDDVIGFFTVECVNRKCVEIAEGVFSFEEILSLWNMTGTFLQNICKNLSVTVTSPGVLLAIKEELLLIADTVSDESFGFNTIIISEIMKDMWEVFEGLQNTDVTRACCDALDQCAYQPFTANCVEVLQTQVRAFGLDKIELNNETSNQYFIRAQNSSNLSKAGTQSIDSSLTNSKNRMDQLLAASNLDALEAEIELGSPVSPLSTKNRESKSARFDFNPDSPLVSTKGTPPPSSLFMSRTFPFSGAVPVLMRQLHLLTVRFFLFAVKNNQLDSRGYEITNAIVNAYKTICKSLKNELTKDGEETALSKACQISIDAASLALASESLWIMVEKGLRQFHWTDRIEEYISKAINKSVTNLRSIVTEAQDLMFELLSNKVEDLLESLVFINFEPTILPTEPHESIEEIVDFLKITFMWLTHLPKSIREAVHFTCCSQVASGMLKYLLSNKVTKLNILSILAFDYDIKKLIQFSNNCGVAHLEQCFKELSDIINCLLNLNTTNCVIEHEHVKKHQYPSLNLNKFLTILEKVVPCSSVNNAKNIPKLDKSILRNLVKKLKNQIGS